GPNCKGTQTKGGENVEKLSLEKLPMIPGPPDAPENWRRLAAFHRDLSRRSTKKDGVYFLSYRDAAKVCDGLSHQEAHTITFALATVGVIEIVNKGKAGLNSGEAAEFRYLLCKTENPEEEDIGFDL